MRYLFAAFVCSAVLIMYAAGCVYQCCPPVGPAVPADAQPPPLADGNTMPAPMVDAAAGMP